LSFGQDMVRNLLGDSVIDDEIDEVIETTTISQAPSEEIVDIQEPVHDEKPVKTRTNLVREDAVEKEAVIVSKPQFETFDTIENFGYNETIDLVGDIPVEITVELGRTTKKIGEILEYGPGTVLELDKLVGEPLNLYA